jgi:hypothetical protein
MHGILITLILILGSTASMTPPKRAKAKPRKKAHATRVAASPKAVPPRAPIIGTQIEVVTKDGKQLSGEVTELSALSVKLKSDSGESTLPFDFIASISFGPVAAPEGNVPAAGHPNFTREVESVLTAFGEMEKAIGSAPDYTEYGRQLSELRRPTEHFILKYGSSDNPLEAHSAALLAAALTEYTWARTVWTLKLGRSVSSAVTPGDSPVVADALDLYPEMRPQPGTASVPADKIIDALWKKAVQQVDQTRKLVSQ